MLLSLFMLPYLMAVTFYAPHWTNFNSTAIQAFDHTAYNGAAIPIIGAYDVNPVSTLDSLIPVLNTAQGLTTKHLWPWIFLNRIMGQDPQSTKPPAPYFQAINTIDIFDATGALSDFYALWRLALNMAKQNGAPGIVIDLEAYNNYNLYNPVYIAQQLHITPEQVLDRFHEIGLELGRMTEELYPEALLWTLFTGLDYQGYASGQTKYHRSVGYLVLGILDYAAAHNVPLTVIDGGETTIGYYNPSLQALQTKIQTTQINLQPYTNSYPETFKIGGTIAPYKDFRETTSWLKTQANPLSLETATFKTIEDFAPMFFQLFSSCPYVWIYCASAAPYNPFNSEHNLAYNPVIAKTLSYVRFPDTLPPANELDSVIVVPNPAIGDYRFSDPNPSEIIRFVRTRRGTLIRIYTLRGDHVRTLRETTDSGITNWDQRNDSGAQVASGTYIYHISMPSAGGGMQTKTGMLAIIR